MVTEFGVSRYILLLFCIGINIDSNEAGRVRRVVGGTPVSHGELPMIFSLRNATSHEHLCGGTLLNGDIGMTAAHCIQDGKPNDYTVVLSNAILSRNKVSNKVLNRSPIANFYIHPEYDSKSNAHDIVLMKLKRGFHKSKIQYATLPTSNFGITGDCNVYGYGKTSYEAKKTDNILRKATVDIISDEICEDLLGKYIAPTPGSGLICAMGNQSDACQGDSGSPMICEGEVEGVVSYGDGCGEDVPGVYVRVAAHMPWIRKIMSDLSLPNTDKVQ